MIEDGDKCGEAKMRKKQVKKGKYLEEEPKKVSKVNFSHVIACCVVIVSLCVLAAFLWKRQEQGVYNSIVRQGYTGTQEQWLASLVGEEIGQGNAETAYELAVRNGYQGTETDWIERLTGKVVVEVNRTPYVIARENGFEGSLAEWLTEIATNPMDLGNSNGQSQKTEYELACEYGYTGTFIEWLVSVAE